jgi:hypothetical protein
MERRGRFCGQSRCDDKGGKRADGTEKHCRNEGVRVATYASAKAAPVAPAKACSRTPSNEETDPAWLVGALFMTRAMPESSAYFWAGCECGFDLLAKPLGKHMIFALSQTPSGQTRLSLPRLLNPGL